MKAVVALTRLGGMADASTLLRLTSRRRLRTAVRNQQIVRTTRNRYALPTAEAGVLAAARLSGVCSHLSAAAYWGWAVKTPPATPHVTVPRKRKVAAERRHGAAVHWRDLPPGAHNKVATSRVQTVLDCARDLPFDEALAVADSALRDGRVTKDDLREALETVPPLRRERVRRVVEAADADAANPFESVLRALALEAGLEVEPQVPLRLYGVSMRPDLIDRRRRLVLEAESFEFHSTRAALRKDCRRYTLLALAGWRVIRFSWEDVMLHPGYVLACLRALAAEGRPDRRSAA